MHFKLSVHSARHNSRTELNMKVTTKAYYGPSDPESARTPVLYSGDCVPPQEGILAVINCAVAKGSGSFNLITNMPHQVVFRSTFPQVWPSANRVGTDQGATLWYVHTMEPSTESEAAGYWWNVRLATHMAAQFAKARPISTDIDLP